MRFSQGKVSLLQYPFFPAGTAHPGSRSETPPAFAGGPVRGRRLLCPFTCRLRSVCRGRIYAARQGFAVTRGSRLVARFLRSVGRALPPPHMVILSFKFSTSFSLFNIPFSPAGVQNAGFTLCPPFLPPPRRQNPTPFPAAAARGAAVFPRFNRPYYDYDQSY